MRNLLALLFLTPLLLYSQNKEQAKVRVWQLLEKNNPDAHAFMTELYQLPTKVKLGNAQMTLSKPADFMIYVNDYSEEGILSEISTAVHEACHMYQAKKAYALINEGAVNYEFGADNNVYYLNENLEFLVKETEVFPSLKIASGFPSELKSSRYDTYINTKEKLLGTQQSGVYGLLDEWSAYYNGFRTTLLNFPEYESKTLANPAYFLNFITDNASIKISYYEFKYFILEYLRYARKKEPKIYYGIMENEDFKAAYRAIDEHFGQAIKDYELRLSQIKVAVNKVSANYRVEDDYIWIGNRGVGNFGTEESSFFRHLQDPKYQEVLDAIWK